MSAEGLPKPTRHILLGALAFLLGAQLMQTLRDRSPWPLCAYNMFNRTMPARFATMRVRLRDDAGHTIVADPGEVMPLEFFRARSIIQSIYYSGKDEARKRALAQAVLRELDERPWGAFDETFPAVRPAAGARFSGLEILVWGLDFGSRHPGDPVKPFEESVVYSYSETRP